jgi:hypothetical protein
MADDASDLRRLGLGKAWSIVSIIVGIIVFGIPVEDSVLKLLQGEPVGPEDAYRLGVVGGITFPVVVATALVVYLYLNDHLSQGGWTPWLIVGGIYLAAAGVGASLVGLPPEAVSAVAARAPGHPVARIFYTAGFVFVSIYGLQLLASGLLIGFAVGLTVDRWLSPTQNPPAA